ncbi:hypothetical protein A5741_05730 [Mycolicibacterium conceptionense]|nr:hypothetical protein A5741_05730 [Mycolicibacterium conceptionense]
MVADEADHHDEVGDAQRQPDVAGAADVGAGGGQPQRTEVRRERGTDGQQRHDRQRRERRPGTAGDAEAEFQVPREQHGRDEQHHGEAVTQPVGPGGQVADPRRTLHDWRGHRRHLDGGGRVVTLVAHEPIPLYE